MGVNLSAPHRTPETPGSPGRRSSLQQQDLIVITDYYRGQSAKMHKITQIRSKSQQNLL